MKTRIIALFALISGLWGLLLLRAAYLQFLPHERLNALQTKQFQKVVTLPARRGTIYDRNGKELAMSTPAYSLYADPKIIENRKQTAKLVAQVLGVQPKEISNKIKDKQKRFVWINRLLTATQAEQIRELKIRGLGLVEDWKRVYPNDSLLGSTLGFVGREGQALEGIELFYDHLLRGEQKKVSVRRDARGRPLVQDGLLFTETPAGKDMRLTIDSDIQYFVEAELNQAIINHEAEGGWAVVLDAKTSAIRAISSLPTIDPNKPLDAKTEFRRNRAITDTFEPGSTLKTFVVADALEKKLIKPNTKIFCENGAFKVGGRIIREAEKDHAQGTISVTEVLAYSSNIGTSKIAFMLGDEGLKQGLMNFGFAQKSGIDLPGEAKGITVPLPWKSHLLANVSFGQGITVTPLQMANAYAAIANGGTLNQPYIIESITDVESQKTEVTETRPIRKVLSPETAAQMRLMLTSVTGEKGTGISARVPGYIVGGKTGTAQKVKKEGRGYEPGAYVASFAGFIPANDPKYVIFVALDHPRKGYYGSQIAAPLFSKIASYSVRRDGVTPELLTEKTISRVKSDSVAVKLLKQDKELLLENKSSSMTNSFDPQAPDFKNLTVREVLEKAAQEQIEIKIIGQGRVDSTSPSAGETLDDDRRMTIFLR